MAPKTSVWRFAVVAVVTVVSAAVILPLLALLLIVASLTYGHRSYVNDQVLDVKLTYEIAGKTGSLGTLIQCEKWRGAWSFKTWGAARYYSFGGKLVDGSGAMFSLKNICGDDRIKAINQQKFASESEKLSAYYPSIIWMDDPETPNRYVLTGAHPRLREGPVRVVGIDATPAGSDLRGSYRIRGEKYVGATAPDTNDVYLYGIQVIPASVYAEGFAHWVASNPNSVRDNEIRPSAWERYFSRGLRKFDERAPAFIPKDQYRLYGAGACRNDCPDLEPFTKWSVDFHRDGDQIIIDNPNTGSGGGLPFQNDTAVRAETVVYNGRKIWIGTTRSGGFITPSGLVVVINRIDPWDNIRR